MPTGLGARGKLRYAEDSSPFREVSGGQRDLLKSDHQTGRSVSMGTLSQENRNLRHLPRRVSNSN
ncbi:Hypothetical protein FKW44_021904 [Caligus rogercresseyi]|uniref:Uncharacterized protein n=1 Tax=Caligus rogercresseyi TaxID=217165 RepID=A0A7T8GS06_CALRO|nr:Hypothetical protein FKW44_021904 [Caligus rogercresseyi]